jgi:hypothetical protein
MASQTGTVIHIFTAEITPIKRLFILFLGSGKTQPANAAELSGFHFAKYTSQGY